MTVRNIKQGVECTSCHTVYFIEHASNRDRLYYASFRTSESLAKPSSFASLLFPSPQICQGCWEWQRSRNPAATRLTTPGATKER